jgi:hypothetical protein
MELREALAQVADIRSQMAQTLVFRGYRSATTAFSGVLAICAGIYQHLYLSDPVWFLNDYLHLWLFVALLSMATVGIEMGLRCAKSECSLQREMTLSAVQQFIPCLVAGALLTYVLIAFAGETIWMLPGLWMILFSMGIFSSRRFLPGLTVFVGAYYLLAGLLVLTLPHGEALRSYVMAGVFGFGQFFAAGVLYVSLERRCGEQS